MYQPHQRETKNKDHKGNISQLKKTQSAPQLRLGNSQRKEKHLGQSRNTIQSGLSGKAAFPDDPLMFN